VLDPRFPGGTSASAAADIRVLARHMRLSVVAIETAMFRGRDVHPGIARALEDLGITVSWNPPVVHADTIVFYNPSCLRFDTGPAVRLSCAQALVVTNENFLGPNGSEGHDVAICLDILEASLVAGERYLAPITPYNRRTVEAWLARDGRGWRLTPADWLAVLDPVLMPPTRRPRDRRGRHSRPGLEKFPPLATMLAHFPPHAERCAILGGDGYLLDPATAPAHWQLLRFGEAEVAEFLSGIDFFVYFTHPLWRESFGRVIAEAIAAGKLVITDPGTAAAFGDAVVASDGSDVDGIIAGFVADPNRYVAFVEAAQRRLSEFRPAAFAERVKTLIAHAMAEA
jgi:glycosyltransferase involved in cell wall biosynthesis